MALECIWLSSSVFFGKLCFQKLFWKMHLENSSKNEDCEGLDFKTAQLYMCLKMETLYEVFKKWVWLIYKTVATNDFGNIQILHFTDEKETPLLSRPQETQHLYNYSLILQKVIELYSYLGGALYSDPQGVAQVMIQSFQLSSCAVFNAQMQDVSPMCL